MNKLEIYEMNTLGGGIVFLPLDEVASVEKVENRDYYRIVTKIFGEYYVREIPEWMEVKREKRN